MTILTVLLNIILPLFGIIFLGFLAEKSGLLGKENVNVINRFVYYFPLPVLLFGSMVTGPITQPGGIRFLAAFSIGTLLTFALSFFSFKLIDPKERLAHLGLKSLGASFPNAGYIGVPLLIAILGHAGIVPAALVAVLVYIVVILAIFLIEIDLHHHETIINISKKTGLALAKNPLIMASFFGILCSMSHVPMPNAVIAFYKFFGAAAAPCALFAIGQTIAQKKICDLSHLSEVSLITFFKLILHPLVTFSLLVLFKVPQTLVIAGALLAALPTGSAKYLIAQHYRLYEKESSSLIVLSTLLSMVTVTVLMAFLHVHPPDVFHPAYIKAT